MRGGFLERSAVFFSKVDKMNERGRRRKKMRKKSKQT